LFLCRFHLSRRLSPALADVRILSAWMRLGSVALLLSRIGGLMRPQQRGKKRQKNVSPHAS
jgi:hypothetical protein